MSCVFRRTISLGVVALAFAVLPSIATGAAMPAGPRLAATVWSLRDGSTGLVRTDPLGGSRETLFSRRLSRHPRYPVPAPLSAPSWSPDGRLLAFAALVGEKHTRFSSSGRTKIFLVSAEGGEPWPVAGTDGGLNPVFAPDGSTIAFSIERRRLRANGQGGGDVAYESESIWLTSVNGGGRTQLTPWRNGLRETPSSFSPDGSALAATRRVGEGDSGDAVKILLSNAEANVIAKDAMEPVYSPDGAEIAFVKGRRRTVAKSDGSTTATITDLFVMGADGTTTRRLTHTPKAMELYPSWDPSGERLVYTRLGNPFTEAGFLGLGGAVMEVNRDGTCPTKVLAAPRLIYAGATWQPGLERAAGPISCQ